MESATMRVTAAVLSMILLSSAWGVPAGAQELIINPDSTFSVSLPSAFHPAQINPAAQLQFADSTRESYFMALTEAKEDLFGWNLTRHSTITLAQMLTVTDFPEVSPRIELELGGFPAVQYELKGVSQGTQIAYLHTTVELPSAFVQILLWTKRSQWESLSSGYREILESFEGLSSESAPLVADPFGIVPGRWAWESSDTGCESNTQTFFISPDGQSLTITHSEPFERANGELASVTEYVIEGSGPTVLNTYIPNETRLTDAGVPVKWDLVVVARNRLAWHQTDWVEGGLTGALRRCEDSG